MQEIKYEDGEETKELFKTFAEAIEDAKLKELMKPIKKLTITRQKVTLRTAKKRRKR